MKVLRSPNRLEKIIMKVVTKETRRRQSSLWGQSCWIEPRYCGIANGDGRQVVYLKTGDNRPDYYVLRIDSNVDIDSDEFDPEVLLCCIEEQYRNVNDFLEVEIDGKIMYTDPFGDDEYFPESITDFPCLSTGNGYWWGSIKNFKS